jgi:hypothetical protein
LLTAGTAWIGVTAFLGRHELEVARAESEQLRTQLSAGQLTSARATAAGLHRHTWRAQALTAGPAWALGAHVPILGRPLVVARGLAQASEELAGRAIPQAIAAATRIGPGRLRSADGRIDLATLRQVEPAVEAVAASVRRAAAITESLPPQTWLHPLDRAAATAQIEVGKLRRVATQAVTVSRILPTLFGEGHPRTYFVAFQNDAEARGTGGLPGAFAILQATDGRLEFKNFYPDTELAGVSADVNLGEAYDTLWGKGVTENIYVNSNISPHFPDAARIWAAMWRQKTGQVVDGALALDPETLSYLLAVTGPAALPDGEQVTAANVVELTQNSSYLRFGADSAGRKQYLIDVARVVAQKLTAAHGAEAGLLEAVVRAAGARRLMLWSADPALQADIERLPVSGSVPQTTAPYAALTVINDGGNKLDYYLDRSLRWEATTCGATRAVTVTVELRNSVPADISSPWITARSDHPEYPVRPGDNRVLVYYAATDGAQLVSATLDGHRQFIGSGIERGHPVFSLDVELPRMQARRIVLNLLEPAGPDTPIVPEQPLVRPMQISLAQHRCE